MKNRSIKLIKPGVLKRELPISSAASKTVHSAQDGIRRILQKKDKRLLAIVGPCSIHDEKAALEYAARLKRLTNQVSENFLVVMRVYFAKPRTNLGWKGFINDPHLDGTCDINEGLRRARKILLHLTEMGVPTATEMLDPITPRYLSDLVSWAAIGARTTESQIHRELASSLCMPLGFKNNTDGNYLSAINAMLVARCPQYYIGIDNTGQACIVKTEGNPWCHVVLRGGLKPNYDSDSIEKVRLKIIEKNLPEAIMVDCAHANSMKKCQEQAAVWENVVDQYVAGNKALMGLMLESNLHEGKQTFSGDVKSGKYGVSITDECISWATTEELLLSTHKKLAR